MEIEIEIETDSKSRRKLGVKSMTNLTLKDLEIESYALGVSDAKNGRIFRSSVMPAERLQSFFLTDYDRGWWDEKLAYPFKLRWRG